MKAQDKTISFLASQIEFLKSELTDLATSEFDRYLLLLNQMHPKWMVHFYPSNEIAYFVFISLAY